MNSHRFFSRDKSPLARINKTFLFLILKTTGACSINEFRPISLCNVIYKIISKVVANRLKSALNKVIGPFQSAFVNGRHISDNYIVAHEIIHSFKRNKNAKHLGLKLDMAKAYDRMK